MRRAAPRQTAPRQTGGAQAIRRAVEIVRVVAQMQGSGANLSRVARATGLNVSTAFRILRSLTEERLLRYDQGVQNYFVGPLTFELGLAASAEAQVQAEWRDTVDDIARRTRMTTYLVARSGTEGVCLLCVEGSTALRAVPAKVGQRTPLGMGSASLALLSSLDDGEIERIIAELGSRLDRFPGGTGTPERIRKRVQTTRRRGFAIVDGILSPGVTGIGVAVPRQGMTQLAISVAGASSALHRAAAAKMASVVKAAIAAHTSSRRDAIP